MQINQTTLANFFRSFRVLFLKEMQGAEPEWPKIAMRMPSNAAEEVYAWLGAMPGLRKMMGKAIIQNFSASDYRIKNDEYESTIPVKEADIERDRLGIYTPLMSNLAVAAAASVDALMANTLEGGFTNADYTGKNFFDTNKKHEPNNSKSLTFTNLMTAPLSANSFAAAKALLKGMKNSQGNAMGLGKKLLLVVPPALESMALQILTAENIAATAKNTDGTIAGVAAVTNVQKGTADYLVWSQLAGSDTAWFLLEVGLPVKALIYQDEKAIDLLAVTTPQSEHVVLYHEYIYQAYARFGAGYGLPQLAIGSTGVGAAI